MKRLRNSASLIKVPEFNPS